MKTQIMRVRAEERETLANLLEKYNYEFSQYDKRQFDDGTEATVLFFEVKK